MATNSLVHEVTVRATEVAETAAQLIDRLVSIGSGDPYDDFLDKTYAIDLVVETLSDGSEKHSIRIRAAETI